MVFLSRRKSGSVVLESSNNMDAWSEIEPVLQNFARSRGLDIFVSNPHGFSYPPQIEAGKLFIRFWSAPSGSRDKEGTSIINAYGIRLQNGQSDALMPSLLASLSFSDPQGTTVAQALGNTLYVLFDLPDSHRNAGDLMRLILNQYAKEFLSLNRKKKKTFEKEAEKRLAEYEFLVFEGIYKGAMEDRVHMLESRAAEYDSRLRSAIREARELWGICNNAKREVDTARRVMIVSSGKIKETLEQLRTIAVSHGSALKVTENSIHLGVGQIDIEHEGVVYDIGMFELVIYPNKSGEDVVKCLNLTRKVDPGPHYRKFDHPHIRDNGKCCLGNISVDIEKMVKSREFVAVVYAMITYLRSVNPEDDGWRLTRAHWPIKEKNV